MEQRWGAVGEGNWICSRDGRELAPEENGTQSEQQTKVKNTSSPNPQTKAPGSNRKGRGACPPEPVPSALFLPISFLPEHSLVGRPRGYMSVGVGATTEPVAAALGLGFWDPYTYLRAFKGASPSLSSQGTAGCHQLPYHAPQTAAVLHGTQGTELQEQLCWRLPFLGEG